MKLAVSSYSFAPLLAAGKMTQLDCVSKARELGFDAIEFFEIHPHDGSSPEEYAVRLREATAREGLFISNFAVGADFLRAGFAGAGDAEVGRVKGLVDLAVLLGSPCMRHDATAGWPEGHVGPRGFSDALPLLADACRQVTEYAASRGVRTMVENHGYFCQDSERVERLMNAVGHPNFGWLVDMGNFLCADEDPAVAVGRAANYAFYAHAKDFHVKSGDGAAPGVGFFRSRGGNYLRGAIVGHGEVPVKQCLRILRSKGYDGALGLEFEGMEESLTGVRIGLSNLRRFLGELEAE